MRSYDDRQAASIPASAALTRADAAGLHITAD